MQAVYNCVLQPTTKLIFVLLRCQTFEMFLPKARQTITFSKQIYILASTLY